MPAECVFTLSSGRKCRGTATRGHAFCRHHGAPAKSSAPAVDPYLWNRRSCWLHFGRELDLLTAEEIPGSILNLLQALLDNVVSDRFAGRCLRILLQRFGSLPPEFLQALHSPQNPPDAAPRIDPETEQLLRRLMGDMDPQSAAALPRSRP